MSDYYFKYPAINELSVLQMTILYETSPVAITGGDCFSRSVSMLWRHIHNHSFGKRSLLLTYSTQLKQYLIDCCKTVSLSATKFIGTCLRDKPRQNWDEIIIIEAEDMPIEYYKEIKQFGLVSYSIDDSSILFPEHSVTQIELSHLFPDNKRLVLNNYLIGKQSIMRFCKQAFPNASIPKATIVGLANNIGKKPVLLISGGDMNKQNKSIIRIIESFGCEDHNIAVLAPWKNDISEFEKILDDNGVSYCSYCPPDDYIVSFGNIHLTTFKSVKGMKFDTVIIPNFHRYKEAIGKYNLNWQDFYVACSCATENLYLISNYALPELSSITNIKIL